MYIHTVICDESHYLKNPKAVRTSTIVPFIRNAKRAMLLSGTCMHSVCIHVCIFCFMYLHITYIYIYIYDGRHTSSVKAI